MGVFLITGDFRDHGFGAVIYDVRHHVAEKVADPLKRLSAALVFRRVMKQGGNSFILVASVIKNVMLVTASKWEMYGISVDFLACLP